MELNFIQIEEPRWAGEIKETLDSVEEGVFEFEVRDNGQLGEEWWQLCGYKNNTIGYGWIDTSKGDFEISLVVKEEFRGNSQIRAGKLILSNLEEIAKQRNIEHIWVVVKGTNDNKYSLIKWFYNQGYKRANETLEDLLRFARDFPREKDIDLYKTLNILDSD
jgi:hypothetical protein